MSQSDQCLMCGRFDGIDACEAFPEKIPEKIFAGDHDHSLPYPGDKGLRFKARSPEDATPKRK